MTDLPLPRPAPPPGPVSWPLLSLLLALALQFAGAVWWAASSDRRITAVENAVQPLSSGVLARIDERTLATQKEVERLNRRLDGGPR